MAFHVEVLGASGTFPTPGSATTGFLLRSGDFDLWLDAGTGTFANLQRHTDYFEVDAVVISHLHLDHILDLYPFYYALRYSNERRDPTHIPVYSVKGAEEFLTRMLSEDGTEDFGGYLDFEVIEAGKSHDIGPFGFSFQKCVHPTHTLAMKIALDGKQLAYTADTGYSPDLGKFFEGCSTLIAEATLLDPMPALEHIHMTAEEAGLVARESGADRLVLTHISPGLDIDRIVEEASKSFPNQIVVASDGMTIEV